MDKKYCWLRLFWGNSNNFRSIWCSWIKKVLSLEQLATFEVGVRYQMYHVVFFYWNFYFLGEKERSIIFI